MINIEVKLNPNIDNKIALDRALKRLKTKLLIEGTLDTVRAKSRFENPKKRRERKIRERLNKRKILGY
jgi:small subunit ribosomal protein S21